LYPYFMVIEYLKIKNDDKKILIHNATLNVEFHFFLYVLY
jgi:hypothetical protein